MPDNYDGTKAIKYSWRGGSQIMATGVGKEIKEEAGKVFLDAKNLRASVSRHTMELVILREEIN